MATNKKIKVSTGSLGPVEIEVQLPDTAAEWLERGYNEQDVQDEARKSMVIAMQAGLRPLLKPGMKDADKLLTEAAAGWTKGGKPAARPVVTVDMAFKFTAKQVEGIVAQNPTAILKFTNGNDPRNA
jgi:hypothetical protein